MAARVTKRHTVLCASTVHPEWQNTPVDLRRCRHARAGGLPARRRRGCQPRRCRVASLRRRCRRGPGAVAQLLRQLRGPRGAWQACARRGRAVRRRGQPDPARHRRAAERLRRRHRGGRGPASRQRRELRRPRSRLLRLRREVRAPDARPRGRQDRRRRRGDGVRAHALDARAAHPSREGDEQHLQQPRAQRAHRVRVPLGGRAAGTGGHRSLVRREGALPARARCWRPASSPLRGTRTSATSSRLPTRATSPRCTRSCSTPASSPA